MNIEEKFSPEITVPKVLSDGQVQFYVDNGYLIAPGLITSAELEVLKSDIGLWH